MDTMKFSKKLTNGYVTDCNIEVLPMLHCRQLPRGQPVWVCAMKATNLYFHNFLWNISRLPV